ncbi:MAG: hypothetical protein KC418_06240 [Anaerolineales bacterium]|nr:hypothetical protein [Anaerolineales bacterium]
MLIIPHATEAWAFLLACLLTIAATFSSQGRRSLRLLASLRYRWLLDETRNPAARD